MIMFTLALLLLLLIIFPILHILGILILDIFITRLRLRLSRHENFWICGNKNALNHV